MFMAGSRFIFFLAFAVGALVLGATFYLEYGPGLKPCWLCQVQRFFLLGFCFVNLMAYAHAPKRVGLWCYSLASSLFALGGAASALRQVWLQQLGPDQLVGCPPEVACSWHDMSAWEIISMIYRGSEDCTQIHWTVFDLSIPELSLLAFLVLIALGLFQISRSLNCYKLPRGCDVK